MFRKYNLIEYPIKINGKNVFKNLSDISTSIKIVFDTVQNLGYFDFFRISEGETAESIAFRYYGDPKYHYIVMLSSFIFSWKDDLPLTQSELEYYIEDSYVNPNGIHHYIDATTGKRTNESHGENIIPITNREFEEMENEKKREIKLIKPEYISTIDETIKGLL